MPNFSSGFRATQRSVAQPVRVTEHVRPGNPPEGLKGITGKPAIETFGDPRAEFTEHPRKALKAPSTVRGSR